MALTDGQSCEEVLRAVQRWELIVGEDHVSALNMYKSALLYRMIVEGKGPLPTPPSIAYAAGSTSSRTAELTCHEATSRSLSGSGRSPSAMIRGLQRRKRPTAGSKATNGLLASGGFYAPAPRVIRRPPGRVIHGYTNAWILRRSRMLVARSLSVVDVMPWNRSTAAARLHQLSFRRGDG